MTYVAAVWTTILPWLWLTMPGIALMAVSKRTHPVGVAAALTIIWSLSINTLAFTAASALGISGVVVAGLIAVLTVVICLYAKKISLTKKALRRMLLGIVLVTTLYGVFVASFWLIQDGLPSGDSQKAIYWAQYINQHAALPGYQTAVLALNRDPVDFYTPGLHALLAGLFSLTSQPLLATGLFAIAQAVAICIVAVAFVQVLTPRSMQVQAGSWAVVLLLTNIRFLRYVREPGYHFQNIVGELLLWGIVLLGLLFIKNRRPLYIVAIVVAGVALFLSHQFSAFLIPFAILPIVLVMLYQWLVHRHYATPARQRYAIGLLAGGVVTAVLAIGLRLNLLQKIPHIFSSDPHLVDQLPQLVQYPALIGPLLFFVGIAGLVMIFIKFRSASTLAVAYATVIFIVLSQAPRFYLDIPPVRALFYAIVPLSVCGGWFLSDVFTRLRQRHSRRSIATIVLASALVAGNAASSIAAALAATHEVRTNATLLAPLLTLMDYLRQQEGQAVLIDDYNRKSSSWLLLAGHPTYVRLAAEIERVAEESAQSQLRRQLYVRQLDYEKIYSLGSLPDIAHLLAKHDINWLTGIAASSDTSFRHNPALREVRRANDVVLYQLADASQRTLTTEASVWLMRASTLANDIGDAEDTFEHLPASVRAPRLSAPAVFNQRTYRTSTAPVIPLVFNVKDFVYPLWHPADSPQQPPALEVYVQLIQPASVVLAANGHEWPINLMQNFLHVDSGAVEYDEQGFVTFYLLNPLEQPIDLDLIALGLARNP